MPSEKEKIELKWYHLRRVRLTREYVGGVLAGFGGGIATTAFLIQYEFLHSYWVLIKIGGLFLVSIGAFMALYAQDRYTR
ncbi:MAG: hypothetical protein WCB27_12635 [Thermoguttaceae bacterium]|jgi:hypothetical protein